MLREYSKEFNYELFQAKSAEKRRELLDIDYWDDYRRLCASLGNLNSDCQITRSGIIEIGSSESLSADQKSVLQAIIERLIPWRKGPFRLCGEEIDAEWRSGMKWERIAPVIGDLSGKRVADIGCGNGYYMMRLAEYNPELILGLDPNAWAYNQFQLMQRFAPDPRICFELLGIEDVTLFPRFFDLVLCMGVIYHRRDPLSSLRELRDSLRDGGRLLLESMTVPIEGPYSLCPPDRYSKLRNVWFVPSEDCMYAWLKRVNFSSIEKVCTSELCNEEQRRTALAPFESLEDFLMPGDPTRTIEGLPAPRRTVYIAVR